MQIAARVESSVMATSERTVKIMVAKWRKARLEAGEHVLGYKTTNILHPTYGVGMARRDEELGMTDAQKVQAVVEKMHGPMRATFEAWELGLIRGDNARNYSQRARALILGLDWAAYRRRYRRAVEFIKDRIEP